MRPTPRWSANCRRRRLGQQMGFHRRRTRRGQHSAIVPFRHKHVFFTLCMLFFEGEEAPEESPDRNTWPRFHDQPPHPPSPLQTTAILPVPATFLIRRSRFQKNLLKIRAVDSQLPASVPLTSSSGRWRPSSSRPPRGDLSTSVPLLPLLSGC